MQLYLKKLEKYGIKGLENDWFNSYLTNRKQFCRINEVSSKTEDVNCGVPQSSCLGPLLFLIYINDIPFCLKNCEVTMYADDTKIFHSPKNIGELNEKLENNLHCLKQWLHSNKPALNVITTQAMIVGSRPNLKKISNMLLKLLALSSGTLILMLFRIQNLGVMLDQHLVRSTKISRALGFLK